MAGTSYTRQSTIADGNLISASLFNSEYNQIVNAFAYTTTGTTGHTHDGSAGQGGAIAKIGDQDFKNKIVVSATDNRIEFYSEVGGSPVEQVRIQDGAIVPVTDSDVDLGTTSVRFKDAFVDSVTVTNNIVVAGTVDGRDVAADGTKLDGIEASATADQTDAEIRAAVEAATDSNVFTDADHTKLNAIEASADVTDTTNVTAAGALMDSEVTNLAQVKAFDSSDYATAAQGTKADAALPTTGGAMTGAITTNSTFDGRDVAADGTKLDGIEAGADVTDTTNVVASLSAGTGISLSAGGEIANTAPDQTVALTGAGGTSISGTYPNFTITSSSFALPVATDTTLGGIELFSDTDQTVVANAVTTTAARTYGIQLNSDDQAVVNVPWTDTTYTVGDGGLTEINFTSADNTKLDGIEAGADVTDTANVTAAGALMTTGGTLTGDLNFGDNDKATFGASDDLQIYHDGSNSFISDVGTGDLIVQGSNAVRVRSSTGENMAIFNANGASTLQYDNGTKLATTSTGIDVTGGMTTTGNVGIGTSSPSQELHVVSSGTAATRIQGAGSANYLDVFHSSSSFGLWGTGEQFLQLVTNNAERARIDSSGNLLVGTTAQYGQGLSLNADATAYFRKAGDAPLTLRRDSTDGSILNFYKDGTTVGSIGAGGGDVVVASRNNKGFKIYAPNADGTGAILHPSTDASGNPLDAKMDLGYSSGRFKDLYLSGGLRVDGTDSLRPSTDDSLINISGGNASNSGANYALFGETHASLAGVHRWRTNGSEAMRIDSSGNLLVGKTSADVDTAGTCLRGSISSIFTVDGNVDTQVAIFNRKSNDGSIVDFRKDGTTVGSIQSRAGVVSTIVLDPRTNGAGLTGTQNAVEPTNESGVNTDGVLSLGGSSSRFKDLHLSGTANVGSIALGDNGQATFGASDDLKIYHDGSNSYVTDTGTGNLFIGGSSYVDIGNGVTGMGGQTYARFNTSGSCQLNYNGVSRLTTTSAGVDVNGSITIAGGITEDAETLTGTATTIDLATATNFTHTLTGATTYTFSNPATTGNATAFTLKVIQDTTARTITWPASVDWAGGTAPTLTTTSGGVDVFVFYTIDGGTTYYGFTAGQAMA